nr:hypothetical protein [Tanacetum cinerariifolium]
MVESIKSGGNSGVADQWCVFELGEGGRGEGESWVSGGGGWKVGRWTRFAGLCWGMMVEVMGSSGSGGEEARNVGEGSCRDGRKV